MGITDAAAFTAIDALSADQHTVPLVAQPRGVIISMILIHENDTVEAFQLGGASEKAV